MFGTEIGYDVTSCGRNQTRSGQQSLYGTEIGYDVTSCGRNQTRSGQQSLHRAETGYDVTSCGRNQTRSGQLSLLGSGTQTAAVTKKQLGRPVVNIWSWDRLRCNQLCQRRKENKPVITALGCGSGDNVASCGSGERRASQLSLLGAMGLAIM